MSDSDNAVPRSPSVSQSHSISLLSNDASFSDEEMAPEPPLPRVSTLKPLTLQRVNTARMADVVRDWIRCFETDPGSAVIDFAEVLAFSVGSQRRPDENYYTLEGRCAFLNDLRDEFTDDMKLPVEIDSESVNDIDMLTNMRCFATVLTAASLPRIFLDENFEFYVYATLFDMAGFTKAHACRRLAVGMLIKVNTVLLKYILDHRDGDEIPELQNSAKAIYSAVIHKGFKDHVEFIRLHILQEIRTWLRNGSFVVKIEVLLDSLLPLMKCDSCPAIRFEAFKVFKLIVERMQPPLPPSVVSIFDNVRDFVKFAVFDDDEKICVISLEICTHLFFLAPEIFAVEDHNLYMLQILNTEHPEVVKAAAQFFLATFPADIESTAEKIRFFVGYFTEGSVLTGFNPKTMVDAFYPEFEPLTDFDGLLDIVVKANRHDKGPPIHILRLLRFIAKVESAKEDHTIYHKLRDAVYANCSALIHKHSGNALWDKALWNLFFNFEWQIDEDDDMLVEEHQAFVAYGLRLTHNGFFRVPEQRTPTPDI
uniref:Rap-GAP domain-containing protein n=1 Tax=Panagrellus redivivus TaxID=6233 RepID=A0A7E4VFG6_PANRE